MYLFFTLRVYFNRGVTVLKVVILRARSLIAVLLCGIFTMMSAGTVLFYNRTETAAAQESIPLPIIMYHHISPKPERQNKYTVSVKEFESDLLFLKSRGYEAVSLSQLLSFVNEGEPLPEKPVMITFDDGFESFYVYALPLLKKHNMSAVMAVVGAYADKFTEAQDHHVEYSYLTWEEIGELSHSGFVEIGNHTDNLHVSSPARRGCRINKGENEAEYLKMLRADLSACQEKVAKATGEAPKVLVYPFGYNCKQSMILIREMGFSAAFTCEEKVNRIRRGNTDYLYRLGRFNRPHGVSSEQFFKKILVN